MISEAKKEVPSMATLVGLPMTLQKAISHPRVDGGVWGKEMLVELKDRGSDRRNSFFMNNNWKCSLRYSWLTKMLANLSSVRPFIIDIDRALISDQAMGEQPEWPVPDREELRRDYIEKTKTLAFGVSKSLFHLPISLFPFWLQGTKFRELKPEKGRGGDPKSSSEAKMESTLSIQVPKEIALRFPFYSPQ